MKYLSKISLALVVLWFVVAYIVDLIHEEFR